MQFVRVLDLTVQCVQYSLLEEEMHRFEVADNMIQPVSLHDCENHQTLKLPFLENFRQFHEQSSTNCLES